MKVFVWQVVDTLEGKLFEVPDLAGILNKDKLRISYETHAGFLPPQLQSELNALYGKNVNIDVRVLDSLPRFDDAYQPFRNVWNGKTLNAITGGRLSRNAYASQIRIDDSREPNAVSRPELEEFLRGSLIEPHGATALPKSSTLGELQAHIYFMAMEEQARQRGIKINSYEFEKHNGTNPMEHMRKHVNEDVVFMQLLKNPKHAEYLMGKFREARAVYGHAPRYMVTPQVLDKYKTKPNEVI